MEGRVTATSVRDDPELREFTGTALGGLPGAVLHEGWSSSTENQVLQRVYVELTD